MSWPQFVDRVADRGQVTFSTRIGSFLFRHRETRGFCHPFIRRTSFSNPNVRNVVDVAGLGLAVLRGIGPARVELRSFRVYRMVYPRNARVSSILGALSRRSSVVRALRDRLMKRAFERLPRDLPVDDE